MDTETCGENKSRVNWFVLAFAVVLLFVGGLRLYRYYGNKDLVPVEATIERIERVSRRNYNVYVTYQYDGVTYSDMKLDYTIGRMDVGDTVTLRIYPANPRNYETPSGVVATLMGIGAGIKAFLRRNK